MVLFVALIAGKKLAENFLSSKDSKWQVFIISLFTLFNPFVYDRLLFGQVGIVFSYTLLIYSFASFLKFIKEAGALQSYQDYKEAVYGAIALALALQFSLHSIFFIIPLAIVIVIYFISQRVGWKIILRVFGFTAIIIFILNANWILAIATNKTQVSTFIDKGITRTDLAVFATAGNTPIEAAKNIVMMSGFWGKDQFRYTDLTDINNFWGRSFLILSPLILWGLITGVRNRRTRALSIMVAILFTTAFFLALGVRSLWSQKVTYWLFDNIPYYKGLRDTQKLVSLIVLSYTVFMALGIKELFALPFVNKNRIAITVFIAGVVIMQAPLLVWGFSGQAIPKEYPATWYEVDKYIVSNEGEDCTAQILFLPWHLYMNFRFTGGIIANPAPNFFSCPVLSGTNMEFGGIYDNSQDPSGKVIDTWIASRGKSSVETFEALGVKYIVLAKEVDWKNYSWINELSEFTLTSEFGDIKLYEIN